MEVVEVVAAMPSSGVIAARRTSLVERRHRGAPPSMFPVVPRHQLLEPVAASSAEYHTCSSLAVVGSVVATMVPHSSPSMVVALVANVVGGRREPRRRQQRPPALHSTADSKHRGTRNAAVVSVHSKKAVVPLVWTRAHHTDSHRQRHFHRHEAWCRPPPRHPKLVAMVVAVVEVGRSCEEQTKHPKPTTPTVVGRCRLGTCHKDRCSVVVVVGHHREVHSRDNQTDGRSVAEEWASSRAAAAEAPTRGWSNDTLDREKTTPSTDRFAEAAVASTKLVAVVVEGHANCCSPKSHATGFERATVPRLRVDSKHA